MSDVLVLNASYEPLTRISWERAITLVVQSKAIIEEFVPDKLIRHKNGSFPWPKIVRLLKYVRVPYSYGPLPFTKSGVLKRDNYVCAYCGKKADTVDHIIPQSIRPDLAREWTNVVSACYPCNHKKGARTPKEAYMDLLYEPTTPKGFMRRGH